MIFKVTHPMRLKPIGRMHAMRLKPIGRMHATLGAARKAALRAAKRLDGHANVEHWRDGRRLTVFADGTEIDCRVGSRGAS